MVLDSHLVTLENVAEHPTLETDPWQMIVDNKEATEPSLPSI